MRQMNPTIDDIEDFVCTLYGFLNIQKVDEVRIWMLKQKYRPRHDEDPLASISSMNPILMPPCHRVLLQKIKRANFVTKLWKSSDQLVSVKAVLQVIMVNGWVFEADGYRIHWYDGDQVPRSLGQILEGNNVLADEDYGVEIDIEYEYNNDDANSDMEDFDMVT